MSYQLFTYKSKHYALDLYLKSVLDVFLFVITEYKNLINTKPVADSISMPYNYSEKSSQLSTNNTYHCLMVVYIGLASLRILQIIILTQYFQLPLSLKLYYTCFSNISSKSRFRTKIPCQDTSTLEPPLLLTCHMILVRLLQFFGPQSHLWRPWTTLGTYESSSQEKIHTWIWTNFSVQFYSPHPHTPKQSLGQVSS